MPKFLGLDAVLAIHHDQIATFGGLHGVRDPGLLESAIVKVSTASASTTSGEFALSGKRAMFARLKLLITIERQR